MDDALDNFLGDEDDWSAFEDKALPQRTGTIFLIDCTPTMLDLNATDKRAPISQSCGFYLGLLACQTVLQNKAIGSPTDMVGLVLMRTRASSSQNQPNIYVLQELAPPNASRILELDRLLESTPAQLDQRFGSVSESRAKSFGLHEALWASQNLFTASSKSMGAKNIFLLTDDPDPHGGRVHANRQAVIKMSDLRLANIALEVLPIKRFGEKFDFDLFYNDLLVAGDGESQASYRIDPSDRLEDLLTRVRSREKSQRCVARFKVHLGPEQSLTIGVASYCLVRREPALSSIFINAKDNQPLRSRRHWVKADGDSMDGEAPLLPHDIVRGLRFGDRFLCFETDELQSAMQDIAPVGLYLLGFKPIRSLKRHYYVRPAQFLYPDESTVRGSRLWFTTLLQTCLNRRVVGLAICVQRKGIPPRLVALMPQEEKLDEEGNQLDPPGFQLIHLPYADDFRELDLPEVGPASAEQVEAAKALVKKLMVPFSPKQISNPVLQRQYAILEALALNRESVEDVPDHTIPNTSAIKRRAADEMKTFAEVCHLDRLISTKTSRLDANASSIGQSRSSAGFTLTEVELRQLVDEKHLSKLTVPQLKQALRMLHLTPSGTKKADLINQITKHFAT
ncbi:Acylaminoacyl-peptidase (S09 family) [Fasciola hepatica]|uniref:Acylaminoacyl-peptidase (S09 family) n=1 Tax=Fasciola hepatica TaxID=6192 RepID=A0A4E0R7Q6_FASHE|nr:Acylaminoacyl-peptidase (S09 family) [Fasciola hepatica]